MTGWLFAILGNGAEASRRKRTAISAAVMALLSLICLPFFANSADGDAPRVEHGLVSFADYGRLLHPVILDGTWDFRWESALGTTPAGKVPSIAIRVPGVWNDQKAPEGIVFPRNGVATYGVTLKGLAPGRYRLVIPTLFVASEVRIDGVLVSHRGVVGDSPPTTRYVWRGQDAGFETDGRDVRIEIRMAAQLHRDNGFDSAPAVGEAEPMQDWTAQRLSQEFLTQIALNVLGIFCLVIFLYRPRDRSFLYFSVAAFALMPASLMLGFDNLLTMAFPGLAFAPMLFIVYMGACVSITMALLYIDSLYPAESPKWGFRVMLAMLALFSVAQGASFVVGGTYAASLVNVWLVPTMLVVFFYLIFVIARAGLRGRDGALPLLIGMGVFCVVMLMVGLIASGLVPRYRIGGLANASFGILVLLFSNMVVLAERWSRAIVASEAMTDDLRQLLEVNSSITSEMELEALLTRIVEVTSRILRAERSSLFLHDDSSGELWALVAEGVSRKILRFPVGRGIAGHVFAHGRPMIVSDAYAHPDFNAAVDELTGFRTRNAIAVPITTREGRKLGVMQALNRINGEQFDEADLTRMRAFAAQAAIALDNATLFSEVIASRNYNESILRSLTNGVITIDRSGQFSKLNLAACNILQIDQDAAETYDWVSFIANSNPHVLEEVRSVATTNVARTMLDAEAKTVTGEVISVNISIVPLMGEEKQEGLLLIFDDISAGKRLEGAMRRFMTQEVMDQVLSREDEMLFGSACQATILFADIRNFTTIAEKMSARETVDMLNEIFTELFEAVSESGGVLDKYIGDAVMAVFGAPLSSGRDAQNAVSCALRMQEMMTAINGRRQERGAGALRLGVGIASGEVVAGTIGSPKRMDYTVIGDSVNLAARLEDLTKTYQRGIVICQRTAEAVGDVATLVELDKIRVKGRETTETIYEVVGRA